MSSSTNYDRILEFIHNNPGSHFRKIKKDLNLSVGTIQYQLKKLEDDGKIISLENNFYKFYFPIGVFQERQKELLQVINHESLRTILFYIIEKQNLSKNEIANYLNISYSSVNWHLERLISYNMLTEKKEGKSTRYSLNTNFNNIQEIVKLLKTHYKSI